MEIHIDKPKKSIKKEFCGTVNELLKELKLNKETVIVVRNGELVTEEESLKNSDKVKILSVVSGG